MLAYEFVCLNHLKIDCESGPEGTFCGTVQFPSRVGDMELLSHQLDENMGFSGGLKEQ